MPGKQFLGYFLITPGELLQMVLKPFGIPYFHPAIHPDNQQVLLETRLLYKMRRDKYPAVFVGSDHTGRGVETTAEVPEVLLSEVKGGKSALELGPLTLRIETEASL
jgi:hypothetical protein